MAESLKLRTLINPEIKVGDKVHLIDGSGLTSIDFPDNDFYIIYAYENLTKDPCILKNIESEVIEVGVNEYVSQGSCSTAYVQDIVIKAGEVKFRTCSNFVIKID